MDWWRVKRKKEMYLGHTTRTVKYCFYYFTQFGKHCQLNIFNISQQIKSDMLPFLKPLQDHTSLSVSHTSFRILHSIKNRRKKPTKQRQEPYISTASLWCLCCLCNFPPSPVLCPNLSVDILTPAIYSLCPYNIVQGQSEISGLAVSFCFQFKIK